MSNVCRTARRVLWDVSGPQPLTTVRISAQAHLETCAHCRAFFEENARLATATRESVFVAAPAGVRERIFERLAAQRAERSGARRLAYAVAIVAVLSVTATAAWRVIESDSEGGPLAVLAADHARAAADERLESGDAREVEEWLTSRVGYGVFVPTLQAARLVGGRVAETGLGRSAVIEYEANGRRVSYFIVEATGAAGATGTGTVQLAAVKGYTIARWRDRGLLHAFVGNLSAAELQKMAHECIEQSSAPIRAKGIHELHEVNT
ncbi:hypothetical protein BH23GEM2_BH23GEM2_15980 [soil metagenome]